MLEQRSTNLTALQGGAQDYLRTFRAKVLSNGSCHGAEKKITLSSIIQAKLDIHLFSMSQNIEDIKCATTPETTRTWKV